MYNALYLNTSSTKEGDVNIYTDLRKLVEISSYVKKRFFFQWKCLAMHREENQC